MQAPRGSSCSLFSLARQTIRVFSAHRISRLPVRQYTPSSTMSTHSIPDLELKSLATEVKKKFEVAISSGDAFFYPSEKIALQESASGVQWQIRTVPALLKKPKASSPTSSSQEQQKEQAEKKEESEKKQEQNKMDVFAPPYVPNLHVKDLGDHVMLLNKFCVVPQHFLMVTREFASQELPPSPATLALAYRIVSAHRGRDTELLSFYNCGTVAGASQPHRHLQFVQCPPLDTTSPEAVETGRLTEEEQDKIIESDYKIPIECLLERIERDGKEESCVHALPLPWQHFVVLLNPTSEAKKTEDQMERYIANKFMSLLDALFRARMFGDQNEGRPAFNLLITKRAMHLIPRSQEEYTGLEGKGDNEKIGNLSINSLGYAGFMLSRSVEEQEALRKVKGGVEEVLRVTGVEPVEDVTVGAGLPSSNV